MYARIQSALHVYPTNMLIDYFPRPACYWVYPSDTDVIVVLNSLRPSETYVSVKKAIIGSDNGLSPCQFTVNWNLRNKLLWNSNRNSKIFIQEYAFENVWKMAAIFLSLNVLRN